jgi:hypothetical protein
MRARPRCRSSASSARASCASFANSRCAPLQLLRVRQARLAGLLCCCCGWLPAAVRCCLMPCCYCGAGAHGGSLRGCFGEALVRRHGTHRVCVVGVAVCACSRCCWGGVAGGVRDEGARSPTGAILTSHECAPPTAGLLLALSHNTPAGPLPATIHGLWRCQSPLTPRPRSLNNMLGACSPHTQQCSPGSSLTGTR